MSGWFSGTSLLAQSSRLESLSSGLRGKAVDSNGTEVLIGFAIVAGLVLLGCGAYALWSRGERSGHFNNPKELFRSLCRAHELDRASRRFLKQLAVHQRLAQPARLFLEPERFEADNLGPGLQSQRDLASELQRRLFATADAS
ncbi:MAG: hypothetical protein DWQ42_15470 [Planctomycetota bacterium]|mgnify:FL=1|nr:MAG: hypothetical protein DWQ42_15470 [Planctomycetota bacterium]REK47163.1 MAG: hypothetical protein DWQ46_04850 [Planctomycetota bacterium]